LALVADIGIRTVLKQQLRALVIPIASCQLERGEVVVVLYVHFRVVVQ